MEDKIIRLFQILKNADSNEYFGEPISQLEHALQSAKIAQEIHGSSELVIAALLHDIGHLDLGDRSVQRTSLGVDHHHEVGADFLEALGFKASITHLIREHVHAKRYLVSHHPRYLAQLSSASLETLRRQGGPMSAEEREAFQKDPDFEEILRLRICDDRAKIPGLIVPNLESYRDRIIAHMNGGTAGN